MFLELLKRTDVREFLLELVVCDTRFAKKEIPHMICEERVSVYEYNLLTGLDALFKYSTIIEDMSYFTEFLDQLRKILKKVQNHNDVQIGISRILIQSCKQKLGLKNINSYQNKKMVVSYIYDRYIVHGYLFHSFPSVYLEKIEEEGIINQNCAFDSIQKILNKYSCEALTISKDISITDSPFMAFFYAYHSPYFMNEVAGFGEVNSYSFFEKDYVECIKNITKFSKSIEMSSSDRNQLISYFNEYWKEYHLDYSFPTVALLKRSDYGRNALREYPQLCEKLKEKDISSIVSSILDPRFNQDYLEYSISSLSIHILKLPTLEQLQIKRVKMEKQNIEPKDKNELVDEYGNVTIVALLGVLLITLGVTITIIMLGGMSS